MRRLIAFEQVSLDGYFVDGNGDMSFNVVLCYRPIAG